MPNMLMAIGTVELPMPLMAPTATSDMPIIKYVPLIILSRDTPQAMDSASPLAYMLELLAEGAAYDSHRPGYDHLQQYALSDYIAYALEFAGSYVLPRKGHCGLHHSVHGGIDKALDVIGGRAARHYGGAEGVH